MNSSNYNIVNEILESVSKKKKEKEIENSSDKEMKLAKIQKRLIRLALKIGRNKVIQHDTIVILKKLQKTRI
jgi:hypothetical protein